MKRPSVSFRVSLELNDGGVKWLGPEANLVDEANAATFEFHRSPTGLQRLAITREIHRILGEGDEAAGLLAWADLEKGKRNASRAVYGSIEADFWPDGRPEDVTDEEKKDQIRRMEDAFRDDDSAAKWGYLALCDQANRLEFMARWNVLAVSVPPAFADLSTLELEDEAIWTRLEFEWFASRRRADADSGKTMPSGS